MECLSTACKAKIETPFRAVKPRVDLRLYRGLIFAVPQTRRSGGTGRRAGFRSQWAQARGGSSPPFGIARPLEVSTSQYLGRLGSTFTAHASIPPPRLRTFEKPPALRISSAFSERAPW